MCVHVCVRHAQASVQKTQNSWWGPPTWRFTMRKSETFWETTPNRNWRWVIVEFYYNDTWSRHGFSERSSSSLHLVVRYHSWFKKKKKHSCVILCRSKCVFIWRMTLCFFRIWGSWRTAEGASRARRVRPGPVHALGAQCGRVWADHRAGMEETSGGLHADEQRLLPLALHLHHPPGDLQHRWKQACATHTNHCLHQNALLSSPAAPHFTKSLFCF